MNSRHLTEGLSRPIVTVTSVTMVAKICSAAAGLISARALGPSDKGVLSLCLLFVSVVAAVGFWGLDVWLLAAGSTRASAHQAALVLRRHLVFAMPCTALVSLVLGVGATSLGWLAAPSVIAIAAAATATVVFFPACSMLLSYGARGAFTVVMLVDCGVFLASLVALQKVAEPSVASVLAVFAAARSTAVLAAVVYLWKIHKKVVNTSVVKPTKRMHREALAFGVPTLLGYLLTLATYRIDAVFLGVMTTAREVGLYSAAAALVEFMWVVPDSAAQLLVGRVAADQSSRSTGQVARVTVLLLVAGSLVLSVAAEPVVQVVYGQEFSSSASLVAPLAAAGIFLGLWKVLVADLAGRGIPRPRPVTALVAVFAMLGTDVLLIPYFGSIGAAVGSIVGYGLAAMMIARTWTHVTGASAKDLFLIAPQDLSLLDPRRRRQRP